MIVLNIRRPKETSTASMLLFLCSSDHTAYWCRGQSSETDSRLFGRSSFGNPGRGSQCSFLDGERQNSITAACWGENASFQVVLLPVPKWSGVGADRRLSAPHLLQLADCAIDLFWLFWPRRLLWNEAATWSCLDMDLKSGSYGEGILSRLVSLICLELFGIFAGGSWSLLLPFYWQQRSFTIRPHGIKQPRGRLIYGGVALAIPVSETRFGA